VLAIGTERVLLCWTLVLLGRQKHGRNVVLLGVRGCDLEEESYNQLSVGTRNPERLIA
jgi:hypothetical protein